MKSRYAVVNKRLLPEDVVSLDLYSKSSEKTGITRTFRLNVLDSGGVMTAASDFTGLCESSGAVSPLSAADLSGMILRMLNLNNVPEGTVVLELYGCGGDRYTVTGFLDENGQDG